MPTQPLPSIDRRAFLRGSTVVAAAAGISAPFQALSASAHDKRHDDRGKGRSCSPDYGPLSPVKDETTGLPLLLLPEGFEYVTFGWTGDPLADGTPTPAPHDGMAAFRGRRGRVRLVRNHEVGGGPDAFAPALAYDPHGGRRHHDAGVRHAARASSSRAAPASAARSATAPAARRRGASWLTCEETIDQPARGNA